MAMPEIQAAEITGRSRKRKDLGDLLWAMSKVAMTEGGPTRTSDTGTVGREAEANTIAKGMHHDCQPACQDPNQLRRNRVP